jgi:hypothetical protein
MTGFLRDLATRLRCGAERRVHLIVRSSGADGFALFGGHRPRHFFSRLYLGTREHRVHVAIHSPDDVESCRKLAHDYGLVIFAGNSVPSALMSDAIHIPGMVELAIDMPERLDGALARWSRSAQADIKKVLREGFSYEVQTGDSWVREFHRRFYCPSMSRRHAQEAFMRSVRMMTNLTREPGVEFLRIVREGVWVGGCLNRSTPDGYRLHNLGWLDGQPELLKGGVVSAIYWSAIRRADELGHSSVKLGSAAPYLEDGLLFFKGKWGARVEPLSNQYGEFRLLLDPSHETCRRFLAAHSLIARDAAGGAVVYSSHRPNEVNVPPSVMAGVSRWYRWLERPRASVTVTREAVPAHLRAWLLEEELPPRIGLPAA